MDDENTFPRAVSPLLAKESHNGNNLSEKILHSHEDKRSSRRHDCIHLWYILAAFLFALLAEAALLRAYYTGRNNSSDNSSESGDLSPKVMTVATWDGTEGSDCGNSVKEAQAKGCIFDVSRYSWVPPDCYDDEAAKDEVTRNSWEWYSDRNGTTRLDPSRLMYEEESYTQWGYHVNHCKYLFRLAGRASELGFMAADDISSFSHAVHCGMVLAAGDRFNGEVVMTKNTMYFAKCGHLLLGELELSNPEK